QELLMDGIGLLTFGVARVATVASRGEAAKTALADIRDVRAAREDGALAELIRTTESGKELTGKAAAKYAKRHSSKILHEFGEDAFGGPLPSWRRSLDAMHNLDIELPNQKVLDYSRGAARRATVARGAGVAGKGLDVHDLWKGL